MGNNTTVLILNDSIDQIKKHPEQFVNDLCEQITSGITGDIRAGYQGNAATVIKTMPADVPRVYFTYGNLIIDISEPPENDYIKEYWNKSVKWAKQLISLAQKRTDK